MSKEKLIELYNEKGTLEEVARSVGMRLPALKQIWYKIVRVKPWLLEEPSCPLDRKQRIEKLDIKFHHDNIYRIGIVSDTHLGSIYQQLNSLQSFYELSKTKGVSTIFHAGDLVDGIKKYEGQQQQTFLHQPDQILEYVKNYYPKIEGITTRYIIGNHTLPQLNYENYGDYLNKLRPDLICHGIKSATFELSDSTKIHLQHGDGKNRVYPSELVAIGHFHRYEKIIAGDSLIVQVPCFHNMVVKPDYLPSDIGGLIVDININKINTKFIRYDRMLYDY